MTHFFVLLASIGAISMPMVSAHESNQAFKELLAPIIEKAHSIAQPHKYNRSLPIPIIAIAGCSAVGKTSFSEQLENSLQAQGIRATTLHFDSFIQPEPVKNPLLHPNFNHIQAHAIIAQVIRGDENIVKPTWDLSGPEPVKTVETVSYKDIDLLLFEGEYTLCDDQTYDFLKYSSLGIYLDAADADIIEWNWQRKRGITQASKELFIADTLRSLTKYREQAGTHSAAVANYIITQDAQHNYRLITADAYK